MTMAEPTERIGPADDGFDQRAGRARLAEPKPRMFPRVVVDVLSAIKFPY